ncbi:hypothetical protein [Thalassospira xiamenensis]|uniref:hypothetical protein n=1 Tax=Thalassospira xiamenensis TaxID=220697 RepID=UPI003AA9A653
MKNSVRLTRRRDYLEFDDAEFRKAVYSQMKSLQAQGIKLSDAMQGFVDHCDDVKKRHPKA